MATKVQVGSALNPEDGGQELRWLSRSDCFFCEHGRSYWLILDIGFGFDSFLMIYHKLEQPRPDPEKKNNTITSQVELQWSGRQ